MNLTQEPAEQVAGKTIEKELTSQPCCLCGKKDGEMYFSLKNPYRVYCIEHASDDMDGFSNPKNNLLDKEGNEIVEIMVGKEEIAETGEVVTFHSAVIIENKFGKKFIFCDYDDRFARENAMGEGDEI